MARAPNEANFHENNLLQVGCCGAEGPNDYMRLRQPLPMECRDSVTGNAYFNGCVDEVIWYLEDKSVWMAIVGMSLGLMHVSFLLYFIFEINFFLVCKFFFSPSKFPAKQTGKHITCHGTNVQLSFPYNAAAAAHIQYKSVCAHQNRNRTASSTKKG